MGFYYDSVLYPFTTPMHILQFKPLSFIDRLKLGLMTVYLGRVSNWKKYENITVKEWIYKYVGKKIYDVVWGALLEQKFGARADKIAMTWLYGRIHARIGSRVGKELLGYMNGSFQVLVDTLVSEIKKNNGRIITGTPVSKVIVENFEAKGVKTPAGEFKFDRVIVTTAPALLKKLADFPAAFDAKIAGLEYFGAIVLMMSMKNSLTPYYWVNMASKESPFVALIEHTNFIDKSVYGGNHIAYLGKYLSTDDKLYKMADEEVKNVFFAYLKKAFPAFSEADVIAWKMTREPFSQPIVPLHFSGMRLDYVTPVKNLFSANMSQIYPEDRGMNYSIMLGNEVSEKILKGE